MTALPSAVLAALCFGLGAIIASFVGVLVGRLNTGQGIVFGRSRCDRCGAALAARDLVPVASWLLAGGRARCCGAWVSALAPISELVLGVLFALAYLSLGATLALALFLLAAALLAALVLYDLAHQILPPVLLGAFVFAAAGFAAIAAPSVAALRLTFLVAFVFALFFAALWLFSGGRAMGLADSPLVFGLALLAGRAAIPGFLFSFWIGAAVGIVLLARTPRGSRIGIEVPFAPFLAAGFLLAYFTLWDPLAITALVLGSP
ncbi:MAG: prepilin peptidase [Patescibacteria group bacterium]|nr:A24 family peptidase [Patescibacteria group bacterium]MDE1944185.1 prepilin peptidase [Patescibacteria group bacterium]MDE1945521.1 prepilin peptidase [Patescibacteria group bacterium]MDE2057576.1 prepilin peptidase [Patescibacteria group bacterium]